MYVKAQHKISGMYFKIKISFLRKILLYSVIAIKIKPQETANNDIFEQKNAQNIKRKHKKYLIKDFNICLILAFLYGVLYHNENDCKIPWFR